MEREPQPKRPSVNDALVELSAIESQLYATGAFDSEPAELNEIREHLQRGNITPEDAIARARKVLAGRQDYH